MMEYQPSQLYLITQMNIDYLSKLNYIELRTLASTNKQFATICMDNRTLRNIIYNRNIDLPILPHNYDISAALDELYNLVRHIITIDYPKNKLPVWVNKDLFIQEIKIEIYNNIFVSLLNYFYDLSTYYYSDEINKCLDQGIELRVNKSAYNLLPQRTNINSGIQTSVITLPTKFTEYIKYFIVEWFKNNDDLDEPKEYENLIYIILDLFFMTEIPNINIYYIKYFQEQD